ncbi:LacI family DNA-binding transcriptional regulator [Glycomyces buryatensis]|uniref:LacI family transcriptional regulator n=1 Tax=Glycomyces buryatensis TaxID=2570927 RepID=A0A4S8Q7Q1_9ACTN|nr:LacI family DNA-binding transcriptional regulator [Glycomyces buryatensis]THV38715.1 LacI family transcriptional regulator [Glycomyces buryatensis]
MADVAAKVGVSRALVSLVFRDQPGASPGTRERVFKAASDLGYRPDMAARLLARGRSKVLGILFTARNPYHVDLVEAIYPAAEELGYDLVLSAAVPTRDEHKAIEALIGHRSEALLLCGPTIPDDEIASIVEGIPTVLIGRGLRDCPVDIVTTYDRPGAREVIDYLVGLGHKDIVHVDGGSRPGAPERRRAYRDAMRGHGLGEHIRVLPGNHTEEAGADAARELLAETGPLPTAVFASNDLAAIGLLDVFTRSGINVPEQISIVGYDDSHIAGLSHIDLTTVRQDVPKLAQLAVQAADEQLRGVREPGAYLRLESKLVVRGTSGPPAT